MKKQKQIEKRQRVLIKEIKSQRKQSTKFNKETIKKKQNNFIVETKQEASTDRQITKTGDDQFIIIDNQRQLTEEEKHLIQKQNSYDERIKRRFLERINKQMTNIYNKTQETEASRSIGQQTWVEPKLQQEKEREFSDKEIYYQSFKKMIHQENQAVGQNIKQFFNQSSFKEKLQIEESIDKQEILKFSIMKQQESEDSQITELFPKDSFTVYNDQLKYVKALQQSFRSKRSFKRLTSKLKQKAPASPKLQVVESEKVSFYDKYKEYFSMETNRKVLPKTKLIKETSNSVKDKVMETLLKNKIEMNPSLLEKQQLNSHFSKIKNFEKVIEGYVSVNSNRLETPIQLKKRLKETIDTITVNNKQLAKTDKYLQLVI